MGRLRFATGALGIILGFFVYQYGFFLTLNLSQTLSDWSSALIAYPVSLEVLGAALQLVGGVIAICGLLLCISWIGSQVGGKPVPSVVLRTAQPLVQPASSVRRCKFCNAVMDPNVAFCPRCQRAQG